jgi:hypothetical protein
MITWTKLNLSERDRAFIAMQQLIKEQICQIYGISGIHMNEINETSEINETPQQADAETQTQAIHNNETKGQSEAKSKAKPNRAMRRAFMQKLRHSPLSQSIRRLTRAAHAAATCPRCGLRYIVPQDWPAAVQATARCQCKATVKRHG